MDNNFNENKPVPDNGFSEESTPEQASGQNYSNPVTKPEQNIPSGEAPQGGEGFSQQPVQGFQNMQGFPNAQGFPNVQGFPNTQGFQNPQRFPVYPQYVPGQAGTYPLTPAPKKRRLSGGGLAALIIATVVLFAIIVTLCAMIAAQTSSMNKLKDMESGSADRDSFAGVREETGSAERIVIKLPTSRKPVLEEELYQNKETGLLTTVGVAKMVLPSQVMIEIFGEVPYAPVGSGSGIIISSDGYIVTNAHVVDGAEGFSVKFYDGTREEAILVGMDPKSDLAVIKVDREDLPTAEIGTSADLVIGEEVAIAGAGGGFENTVTYGHVTGLDREINTSYISSSVLNCIQTDAALNYGNSGGALVNMYGQVVGIAVARMNHEAYENIGFSIGIDDAVPIIEELIANGYVSSRSMVGLYYLSVGDSMASSYEIMPGLCVTGIMPESNVAESGIMLYDIITQIDGVRVFGGTEVAEALSGKAPGDAVRLTVFRRKVTGENIIFETSLKLISESAASSENSESVSPEEFYTREIVQ